MDCKVSVVIPVYNVEPYLPACLDSVLTQTLPEIEVLCVDDASTDGSAAVLAAYEEKDARIRAVYLMENRGQGYCRNTGIEAAKGEYLYLLDSDDMITPEALAELYAAAKAEDLDGIFFDSKVLFETEELRRKHKSYPAVRKGIYPDKVMKGPELFESFMKQNEWTCYIQRQFWKMAFIRENEIRFPVRHEHEDEIFPFYAVLLAERVRYLRKTYFIRRYRYDSVMTAPVLPKNFYGYFRCFLEMNSFVRRHGISSEGTDRNMARIYERMVRYYVLLSDRYDLSLEFAESEKDAYQCFVSAQKLYTYYGNLSETLTERAKAASKVYIYGAGAIADNVYEALIRKDVIVEGFFVTKAGGNPAVFKGRPVRVFHADDAPEDGTLLILAVSDGYLAEIRKYLAGTGWDYCGYRD